MLLVMSMLKVVPVLRIGVARFLFFVALAWRWFCVRWMRMMRFSGCDTSGLNFSVGQRISSESYRILVMSLYPETIGCCGGRVGQGLCTPMLISNVSMAV